MFEQTCDGCSKKISLNQNPSGLVFEDKHYVCEDCCSTHSNEELKILTKTVIARFIVSISTTVTGMGVIISSK